MQNKTMSSPQSGSPNAWPAVGSRLIRAMVVFLAMFSTAIGQTGSYDWDAASQLGSHAGIQRAYVAVSSPRNMKINCLRIDTRTPGLRFYTTPQSGSMETMTQTSRQFLTASQSSNKKLVAAINATPWSNFNASEWNVSKSAQLTGLAVSEGAMVSAAESRPSPTFVMSKTALPSMVTTTTGANTADMRTAVTGFDFILTNGVATTGDTTLNPRTGVGLSQDKRYVYFMVIDGRQSGSDGATTDEVGSYLKWFGAWTGINMDGGGSSTMAWWNPNASASELINNPQQTSRFSLVNGERHVANNLGVYYENDTTVVSWGMNETVGNATDAADPLLDGGNNGILSGGGSYVAGPSGFGNVLSLSGTGKMSATVTGSLFANSQQVTMSAWVNLANVNQTGKYLLGLSGADGFIRIDADGFLRAGFETSAGRVEAKWNTSYNQYIDTWTHVAAIFSQGTVSLYINGAMAASSTVAGALIAAPSSCSFGIGQIPSDMGNTSARFHGLIDEVRLLNAAVSQSEVVALMGLPTLTTTYGAVSTSQPFTVSGTNTSSPILVTPPSGCEVSTNNSTFSPTVTVGSPGGPAITTVYIRLSARAAAGSGIGNITLDSGGGTAEALARAAILVWPRPVTGSFTAANKAYDNTTAATVTSRSLTGILDGDTVSLSGGSGVFFNPNVGTARTVSLEDAILTGPQAGNYTLVAVIPTTADITGTGRFAENFNLFAASEYPFPGTPLPGWDAMPQVNGLVPAIVDAGAFGKALRMDSFGGGAPGWALYSTAVLPGTAAGWTYHGTAKWTATYHPSLPHYGTGGLLLSNESNGITGNNWIWIGFSRNDYDGTGKSWSLPSLQYSLGGVSGTVSLGGPAFRDFPEHAPVGLTVTRIGGTITLSIASPLDGNVTKSHTFTGAQAAALDTLRFVGTMTYFSVFQYDNLNLVSGPLISTSGTTAALTTTYGTASATTSFTVSALNMSAGILVTPPAGFEVSTDNTNFSTTVTVGSAGTIANTTVYLRLAATASAGTKSGNIVLSGAGSADVNLAAAVGMVEAKPLTGLFAAADKVYDGTTAATVTGRSLTGIVGSDDVSLSGGTAAFADAAIGTDKMVTLTGANIAGAQAGNYTLVTVSTTTADIRAPGISENFEGYALGDYPFPANPLRGWKYMPSNSGLIPAITNKVNGSGQVLKMNGYGGGAVAWMSAAPPVLAAATPNWSVSADAKYLASNKQGDAWYGQGGLLLSSTGDMSGDYLWVGIQTGWGELNPTTTFARPFASWKLGGVTGGGTIFSPEGAIRMSTDTWGPAVLTVGRTNGSSSLSFVIGSPVDGMRTATLSFSGVAAAALGNLQYAGFANYLSVWHYDNLVVTSSSGAPQIEAWLEGQPLNEENLLKYGVCGAVTIQSPSEAATSSLDAMKLSLTAIVRTDDPDLRVVAETSGNLTTWTTSGLTMETAANQVGVVAGFQRRVFSIPLTNNSTRLFLRLRIIYLPQ